MIGPPLVCKGFLLGRTVYNFKSKTQLEKELKLIRQRLDSIEEALAEEMSEDDKRSLADGLREHAAGKTVPFTRLRKN